MADLSYNSQQLTESPQKKRKREESLENETEEISDEDFLCPICLQLLIEPVVMPCSHELCKVCFTQNVQEANLQCPICRLRISSWARKQARSGTLICQERWELIQKLFPKKSERRMAGEDDSEEDFYRRRPLKRVLSQNGAIRSEYEEEMKKIRKAREEEIKASEEFIRRLMEEEKIVDNQMQQMIENDNELAKKLQQQIQPPIQTPVKPCSSKTAINKGGKGKIKPSSGSQTLEKWFSPTTKVKLTAVKDPSLLSPTSSNIRTNILQLQSCNLKQKQEKEDFVLALKLQEEFDKERTVVNKDVNRQKGTVDEYLLRQRNASTSL